MELPKRAVKQSAQLNSFRMLEYATPFDRREINRVHALIQTSSLQLSILEKKYNIQSFEESKDIRNYPLHERATVLSLWRNIYKGSVELDFLFVDEDLFPYHY